MTSWMPFKTQKLCGFNGLKKVSSSSVSLDLAVKLIHVEGHCNKDALCQYICAPRYENCRNSMFSFISAKDPST